MRPAALMLGSLGALSLGASPAVWADSYFLTVAGLGGEPEYEERFEALANDMDHLLKAAGATTHVMTLSGKESTREQVSEAFQIIAAHAKADDEFVLTLIGHGTFDGVNYKFNLPGPDLSAASLARMCNQIAAKQQLVVNTTSASGASVAALAREGRAVISATKSGSEKNATVFARYWVQALQDPTADVDKNESVSALEAFRYATAQTAAFYEAQKRLATEHPVFADRGGAAGAVRVASTDTGAGRMLASFVLMRYGTDQVAAATPEKHGLLAQKEALERRIDTLKFQRAALSPQEYRQQLTEALVSLAKVQEALEK